jgi:tetratricopeptide (TPR) repeat protein
MTDRRAAVRWALPAIGCAAIVLLVVTSGVAARSWACNFAARSLVHGIVGVSVEQLERAAQVYDRQRSTNGARDACTSASRHIGDAAVQKGDLETARRAYEEALATDPSDSVARFDLAVLLAVQGKTSEAVRVADQAIPASPFWRIALEACRATDFGEAEAYRGVALSLPQQKYLDHLNTGICYWGRFGVDAAIVFYRESVQVLPASAPLHEQLGIALGARQPLRETDLDEAVQHLERALELSPAPSTYYYLISRLREANRIQEAADVRQAGLAYLDAAISASPRDPWPYYYRGLIKGREGMSDLEQAVRLNRKVPDFWLALARAYGADGCTPQAREAFEQTVELLPDVKLTDSDRRCLLGNPSK